MSREEKTPHMVAWWHRANQLLVDEKPHRSDLPAMVRPRASLSAHLH